jgi:hypothetical protein
MSTLTNKQIKEELNKWELRYSHDSGTYNILLRKSREIDRNGPDFWDRDTFEMQVNTNPTGNCQLMSLGNFENMLYILDTESEEVARAIYKCVFLFIHSRVCSKRVLLFDVREVAYKNFRTALKSISNFVPGNSFVYNSSNNTRMRTSVNKLNPHKLNGVGTFYSIEQGSHSEFNDVYHEELNDGSDELY